MVRPQPHTRSCGRRRQKKNLKAGPEQRAIRRYVLKASRAHPIQTHLEEALFPSEHQTILLVGAESALSAALETKLVNDGYRVCRAWPGKTARTWSNGRFEIDISSPAAPEQLQLFAERQASIGMLLNVAAWGENSGASELHGGNPSLELLEWLQVCAQSLRQAASQGGGWIVNVTAIDGKFGLGTGGMTPRGVAGTHGVAKTAAREWPKLRVQCIDLDPAMAAEHCADRVSDELRTKLAFAEVGFTDEGRWQLDLVEEPMEPVALDLGAEPVFLITGGAYGITAKATLALIERFPGHAIIVGRSPLPQAEPVAIQGIDDPTVLRQRLIEDMTRDDTRVRPAEIERRLERILTDRRIRANLAALRRVCTSVDYHALDVRDTDAFGNFIDGVYKQWGRIDGVIHGAGIIEDKLIGDKKRDSFARVFDTKVASARVLADRLRPRDLSFLVFFGSVAGRFGNAGQADYSAANEELNKIAQALNREWPQVRVVSINWGPWDHGMTRPDLRRLLTAKGIGLIPVESGVRSFLDELARPVNGPAEVVLTESLREIAGAGA